MSNLRRGDRRASVYISRHKYVMSWMSNK